ncbi:pyrroline-5-carboxylate reductase [Pararhizobium mangrovi]|uniref:Pyrroline-5-carboxylate reductase n=1 Tax=Pararhizobium mangrovi TaxID=2590452 RepID=A0A506U925_9HYPH|nr:pyrroline-5-carboxylate reductase [Pararhizobium mangrovi]TPW30390.1 pyrroline-5-carboxylate reductase [Pararhizobium mangrovi]
MDLSAAAPVVLVGAGNMGGALLKGWLDAGLSPRDVVVVDPKPSEAMVRLLAERGVRHEAEPPSDLVARVLMLAVKPQMMADVVPSLKGLVGRETVAVSIAAGTPLSAIEGYLGGGAVVRVMPNTPAMVGRGISAAVANADVSAEQRDWVSALLSVCGPVEWVDDEALIDAVTGVSGSGPAYVYYLVECMAEAGRKSGLPDDLAMRLARATVSGAGEMLHRSEEEAATLRANVTSPNGTTAAALSVLMDEDGLQPLVERTVEAARKRAHELGQ